mmetsp:Transcript_16804/g.54258  ORF Transcript_16804/g.54258 Transcript_16804/m.54258 type:complete len:213 (+) Transcript_16804:144-782(+)
MEHPRRRPAAPTGRAPAPGTTSPLAPPLPPSCGAGAPSAARRPHSPAAGGPPQKCTRATKFCTGSWHMGQRYGLSRPRHVSHTQMCEQGRNKTVFLASRQTTQSWFSSSLCSILVAIRVRLCVSACSRAMAGIEASRRPSSSEAVAASTALGDVRRRHWAASSCEAENSAARDRKLSRSSATSAASRSLSISSCRNRSWKPRVCSQSAAMIP